MLVADIGGTNTRVALAQPAGLLGIRSFRNADFDGVASLLRKYLDDVPAAERPRQAALAIAAPVQGDRVAMINIGWQFSCQVLTEQLELDALDCLNDFAALAWALPVLGEQDLRIIGEGSAVAHAPRVVLGPGTGLGVASLITLEGGGWQAVAGEGGHVTLAAQDASEERVIARAREQYGHCSAERLLSGAGLGFLHQSLHGGPLLSAEEVGALCTREQPEAVATFETFFRLLGSVAGNAALTLGALGGVYIAGGIVPRYADRFVASGFRQRFEDKGRYREYLRAIPTWLVTSPYPALTGLAAWARRPLRPSI